MDINTRIKSMQDEKLTQDEWIAKAL